jgi:uncharacterized membrane protein YqjE
MEQESTFSELASTSKRVAGRLVTIGENRLELLLLELQEERERLVRATLLALGVALFAFLAGVALTTALVVLFWPISPLGVLLALTVFYTIGSVLLYRRLAALQQSWQSFPATLNQFKKDRACLEKILS